MEFVIGFITHTLWVWAFGILTQFWGWFVAGGAAVLAFMFSPAIRKYTIAVIALLAVVGGVYFYAYTNGFNANHTVQVVTHTCDEFRKWLVTGPATDKAIDIFNRHGLCV